MVQKCIANVYQISEHVCGLICCLKQLLIAETAASIDASSPCSMATQQFWLHGHHTRSQLERHLDVVTYTTNKDVKKGKYARLHNNRF
jgi:hypothetical protein